MTGKCARLDVQLYGTFIGNTLGKTDTKIVSNPDSADSIILLAKY
jgi:hypothetical protein